VQGWLVKRGRQVFSWRRRFFRLQGAELSYFDDDPRPAERRMRMRLARAASTHVAQASAHLMVLPPPAPAPAPAAPVQEPSGAPASLVERIRSFSLSRAPSGAAGADGGAEKGRTFSLWRAAPAPAPTPAPGADAGAGRKRTFSLFGDRLIVDPAEAAAAVRAEEEARAAAASAAAAAAQRAAVAAAAERERELYAPPPLRGSMDCAQLCAVERKPKRDKPLRFFVRSERPRRELFLQAETEVELERWIAAFQALLPGGAGAAGAAAAAAAAAAAVQPDRGRARSRSFFQ